MRPYEIVHARTCARLKHRLPVYFQKGAGRSGQRELCEITPPVRYVRGHDLMAVILATIRRELSIDSTTALFLFVKRGLIVPSTQQVAHVFAQYAGDDGVLYITYAIEDAFG